VRRLIVGVGSPDAGDDGAGPAVIAALRADPPPDVALAFARPPDLPTLLEGTAAAVIVDACRSGAAPGALLFFDAAAADLPPAPFAVSTHGLGLAAALALARALGALPPVCVVIAVEGRAFAPGAPMTTAVAAAVPEAARLARAALGAAP
jgi:hydrogenase maturation protease